MAQNTIEKKKSVAFVWGKARSSRDTDLLLLYIYDVRGKKMFIH